MGRYFGRPARLAWWFSAAAAALIWALAGIFVVHDRREHVDREARAAERIALALEAHIEQSVQDAVDLAEAHGRLMGGGAGSGAPPAAHGSAAELAYLRADGTVLLAPAGGVPETGAPPPGAFVRVGPADAGVRVGMPFRANALAPWTLPVLVPAPTNGIGVTDVVALVRLDKLRDHIEGLVAGTRDAISLIRADGVLLARAPEMGSLVGADLSAHPVVAAARGPVPSGTMHAPGLDGSDKVVGYRSIGRLGLIVAVGVALDESLADWRHGIALVACAAAAASLAIVLLATRMASLLRRVEDKGIEADAARRSALALASDMERAKERAEQAAAEAARARAEAEAAAGSKDRFMAVMGHELRTPLNAIIGFSDLIRDASRELDPDTISTYAADVADGGRRLLSIVEDVLEIARASGGAESGAGQVDLHALARDAIGRRRDAVAALGLTTEVAGGALFVVLADARSMRRMVDAIIDNAVKFNRPGGRVAVTFSATGDEVAMRVRDTGIGIAAADRERVLAAFEQLSDHRRRAAGGAGLGLTVARALAEAHGGSIGFEGEPGDGTTVVVRLPGWRALPLSTLTA